MADANRSDANIEGAAVRPADATEPPPAERSDFTAIYYLLFALNLFGLLLIGRVNQMMQEGYHELSAANAIWSQTNQRTAALTKAARDTNAPVNDVFNTVRPAVEEERLRASLSDLFALVEREKATLRELPVASQRNRLLANLEQGEKPLQRMSEAARQVFVQLKTGDKQGGDASMALADHNYNEFLDAMSHRDSIIDTLQSDLFLQGEQYRSGLSNMVAFAILIVGLLVLAVLVYGLKLARRTQHATAAARLNEQALKRSDANLRQLNDNLEHLLRSQKRFIADAAHQLRTPIAGINLQIEHAIKADSMAEVRPALAQLQTASRRVVRLSRQLLTLASSAPDTGATPQFEDLDLGVLAREVGAHWLAGAHEKHIDLELDAGEEAVHIRGNAVLLEELVSNLIDNAVRYSPEYGRVTIVVRALPTPRLSVEDNGPGIPFGERENVFERFHRVAGSPGDGAGLGLAIVRDIARLHQAEVSLQDRADGPGLCVSVVFPGV